MANVQAQPTITRLPNILTIGVDIEQMVNALERAIVKHPHGPHLYQRARQLCIIARGTTPPKWLHRPVEMPVIIPVAPARLRELAGKVLRWERWDVRQKQAVSALPPAFVIETLMARPAWTFPVLEGIVCTPTLRPDGSLLTTPGYDPDTGLILDFNGTVYPPLLQQPTRDEARAAIARLKEPFQDFPFPKKCYMSAALAAVLSLVARFAIQGNVPLFAVRSTTCGSGKGLLIDAITMIGTGRIASRWAQTQDPEEERKRLLTIGQAGDPCIHIDNVNAPFGSAALDAALTAPTFSDRILGQQIKREVPMHVIFFASGNNMIFQGDMARRVVPLDLDPQRERPEELTHFTHQPLLAWVAKARPRLVAAALTILRAYFAASRPAQQITAMGSFEAWSDLIRQALIWAGEPDPCEGRQEIEAESDPEYEVLNDLLLTWQARYSDTPKTIREVKDDLDGHTRRDPITKRIIIQPDCRPLRSALVNLDRRGDLNERSIGYALRKWKGRIIGELRFVSTLDQKTNVRQWAVKTG